MCTFNTIRARSIRLNGNRNGDGKLLPWPGQVRSGNKKEIHSAKSKVYAANIARNCAEVRNWDSKD